MLACEPWAPPLPSAQAVEQAFLCHHGSIYRYLVALTRDGATAEDLAQEAFLRLACEIGDGRTPDNVGGWLHRVARNLVTSRARRRHVADRRAPELVDREVARSPEDAVVERERTAAIRLALGGVSPAERRALPRRARARHRPDGWCPAGGGAGAGCPGLG